MTDRQRLMAGKITHADFYRLVAKSAGVSFYNADPDFLDRVRKALQAGDEHLNTIPLGYWDMIAGSLLPTAKKAFKQHGDFYSLSGGVCLCKQMAEDAVKVAP